MHGFILKSPLYNYTLYIHIVGYTLYIHIVGYTLTNIESLSFDDNGTHVWVLIINLI